jgi:hypothetical protein
VKKNPYEDLLDLEHPTFPNHPPMPARDRAAQFQPFAALDGFEAAIERARGEFERLQEETEYEKEEN